MKTKLNEIENYKQLFEYLESDFGKNKTNLELIRDAYERAKLKGYIENDTIKKKANKVNNKIKEKKATVNFDDDVNEEYIEHYNDDDYYENEVLEEDE